MISLTTAKLLFFIAVSLGPQAPHTILATSNSENYSWHDEGADGWSLEANDLPTNGWQRQMAGGSFDSRDARAITAHQWHDGDALQLANGSRVEKQGDAVFYIEHPGCPNQKTFTILFPKED
jgi:hypothetical protein